jgi:hypothetical protein
MSTPITKHLSIAQADHVSGYKILLRFNDGREHTVDFEPFLRKALNPDLTKYRALREFKSFRLHYGNLMWGDYEMVFPLEDLYRGEISEGVEASWKTEVKRRWSDYQEGRAKTKPAREVMRDAFRALKK